MTYHVKHLSNIYCELDTNLGLGFACHLSASAFCTSLTLQPLQFRLLYTNHVLLPNGLLAAPKCSSLAISST